jgi:hypothetical protein
MPRRSGSPERSGMPGRSGMPESLSPSRREGVGYRVSAGRHLKALESRLGRRGTRKRFRLRIAAVRSDTDPRRYAAKRSCEGALTWNDRMGTADRHAPEAGGLRSKRDTDDWRPTACKARGEYSEILGRGRWRNGAGPCDTTAPGREPSGGGRDRVSGEAELFEHAVRRTAARPFRTGGGEADISHSVSAL